MNILGLSCYYHDAAACLVQDGRVVAAVQEEAFTRKKHDPDFPRHAVAFCLRQANITIGDVDHVVFYEKPFLKFERLLETYVANAPFGWPSFLKAMPIWLKQKLWIPDLIQKELNWEGKVLFTEHHESHAASAFYPSPFQEAAFLTMDGVGEWATSSWGVGSGNKLRIQAALNFPHSLGLLYSAFTYFTGFRVNSGEYKLMGLAPYGEPRYVQKIYDHLISVKEDGSYRLNLDYFTYMTGLRMTGKRFESLFGGPARTPESPITQREMDLARSVQVVTEEIMLKTARHIRKETHAENLCLAGGVALNCVANGRLLREAGFRKIWVQPASGDAGGALGAALLVWHDYAKQDRSASERAFFDPYLGPSFADDDIRAFLESEKIPCEEVGYEALPERTATLLAQQQTVGWFQGRMEFGPRALGNRSILADPRGTDVQKNVNLKIKFRESFRPFAPSVLRHRVQDWFDLEADSPYMLLVAPVKGWKAPDEAGSENIQTRLEERQAHSTIPAVTHVDGSARIQTVHPELNPLYHRLLTAFEALTDCPVLVNTSFNVRGEPIVCSPKEAFTCFVRTHLDVLVLGPFLITKQMLPLSLQKAFSPDEIAEVYGLD
ncbi:MAG: carbamoyltransferase [Bacteroidetes Order II. Incertae sedis bacterium]|nr:carbamoyltransferase [Bacteroidetes Order II. bacterium]